MDHLTASLHRFYRAAQRRHPEILFQGNGSRRKIALTFDDGPHPRDTPRLLEVLEKHQVRATFFQVGRSAELYPDLIRQIHQDSHQPALHCYRHVPFPVQDPIKLQMALQRAQCAIAGAAGVPPQSVRDLRPPYGLFTGRTLSRLMEWGYRLVMWSCIPPHWMQPVSWSVHQVMDSIIPGALIVLHDGHGHGRHVAEIVDTIIPRVRSLGFEFVTVDEMQRQRSETASEIEEEEVTI